MGTARRGQPVARHEWLTQASCVGAHGRAPYKPLINMGLWAHSRAPLQALLKKPRNKGGALLPLILIDSRQ